jgi:SapC
MANLIALNSQTHRSLRVSPLPTRESAEVNVVSVIPREFARLLAHYPIFFVKSQESGRFEPAALLGFVPGENLYFKADRWDVDYVPLQIQRHPFSLLPRGGTVGAPAGLDLAIDTGSAHIQQEGGERLFQDDGKPSKYMENIASMLQALVSGSTEAHAFTARLAELGLIESVEINVEFVDRSEKKLQGLYWISTAALEKLGADQLAELRDRKYLEWMYFQMASLSHVSVLVARRNRKLSGVSP